MAEPASWAMAAAGLVRGLQGYQQGRYDARVSEYNAKVAAQNAGQAYREAGAAEELQRRDSRQSLGRSFAAAAQGGGGIDRNIFGQAAAEAELDAQNIRYGGGMEARGLLQESAILTAQARQQKRSAKLSLLAGGAEAAGAVLRGRAGSKVRKEEAKIRNRAPVSMPSGPTPTVSPSRHRR